MTPLYYITIVLVFFSQIDKSHFLTHYFSVTTLQLLLKNIMSKHYILQLD